MDEPEENFHKTYVNLNEEMREEVDECFDIFDKDKDDHINHGDLTTLL